ncbi:hypothetical protein RND81_10G234600 [Saponaria officinalis]|uniref:VOC domain-containing protein n=1 Tax=Saponaria officinalis TaxID=3572 RepID=A0AAW1I7U2_SAPOF
MSSTQEVENGTHNNDNNDTKTATTTATTVVFSSFKPQLVVEPPKAADAVAFYKAAFGAEEVSRDMHPKRKAEQETPLILSAQLKLAHSVFSVSDYTHDDSPLVKNEEGAARCVFTLETEDVEGAVTNAVNAGAVAEGETREVEGGGGRVAKLKDPFGYLWVISSPAKVLTPTPTPTTADEQA